MSNSFGSVTSVLATLVISAPPAISSQPASRIRVAGQSATFSVSANGSASLTHQWRFNGIPFTDGGGISGATSPTLVRANLQPAAAGVYSVVIANAVGGVTSSNATLTVLVPPTITLQPTDQAGGIGSNVIFSVTVDGTAPLSLQWKFYESVLADATNATLVLTNLQIVDEGHYSVVITNQAGSVASQSAYLSILIQPVLSQPQVLVEGDFQALLRGNTNRSYLIEFSTNLVNWFTLTNLTYTNALVPFTDSATTNSAQRFYRARLAP